MYLRGRVSLHQRAVPRPERHQPVLAPRPAPLGRQGREGHYRTDLENYTTQLFIETLASSIFVMISFLNTRSAINHTLRLMVRKNHGL